MLKDVTVNTSTCCIMINPAEETQNSPVEDLELNEIFSDTCSVAVNVEPDDLEPDDLELEVVERTSYRERLLICGKNCIALTMKRRVSVVFWAFFGFFNIYTLRTNFSVALVSMTSSYRYYTNGTFVIEKEFYWNSVHQGYLHSAFFYGYILTQILGGSLALEFGGTAMFGYGIFMTAIITLFIPLFAKAGFWSLFAARFIQGIFEGVTYPAILEIWGQWAPPMERSRLASIAFSGSYFGALVAMSLSGFLAETYGWPYVFYVFGVLALFWWGAWIKCVYDSPRKDKKISDEECYYIISSIGPASGSARPPVPWKRILTNVSVWAIMIAHLTENWIFYTQLTELPTYLKDVYGMDMEEAGLYDSLPYLAMFILTLLGGVLADLLLKYMSTTKARKLMTCGAFAVQITFLFAATYATHPVGMLVCLTGSLGFGGFAWGGFGVNHLDISPSYASVLMGLSNTAGTLPGIISPILTGYLVQNGTVEEWNTVLYIACGIGIFGLIFYAVFASGKENKWGNTYEAFEVVENDTLSASTEDLPYGSDD